MVRPENLESKLNSLRSYLNKLERYRALDIKEIQGNQDLYGATERFLFLACQASIDLAEMLCKKKELGRADSMSESFELLSKAKLIDEELSIKLIQMVGFRNALSHGYEDLDYTIVSDVLSNRVNDLHTFANLLEELI